MIHVEELNDRELNIESDIPKAKSLKEKLDILVDVLKHSDINGCITGSYWLPGFDPDAWGTTPDIDLFVYSEAELIKAINIAQHRFKMIPGKGTQRSEKQERWKIDRLYKNGLNYKIGITTYTFYYDSVMLNITFKQKKDHGRWIPLTNAPDVLMSFDMSIVMQGYDIKSRVMFDLRPDDVPITTAILNPLRDHDCIMWTVAKWIRQFDRVVKYYNRGFDTRPMAESYLEMIDGCIEDGCLFDSDESHQLYDCYAKEFVEKRAQIADWLDAHKED